LEERAIEVVDLWYKYPSGIEALRGVNLVVGDGECIVIAGENGSGKTTLIKHFNGLLKPTRGVVRVYGVDTRSSSVSRLARTVGLVFQNPMHQFFKDRVIDEIMVAVKALGVEGVCERDAEELAEKLGIAHLLYKPPHEASLGEQKRIAIASVLVYKPRIIVLDEPTAGLDYRSKQRILDIIKELVEEGHTVIIVSHDVEFLANKLFNRIVVMSGGRVLFDGDPRECFYNIELMSKAGLEPPQIPELFYRMGLTRIKPLNAEEASKAFEVVVARGVYREG